MQRRRLNKFVLVLVIWFSIKIDARFTKRAASKCCSLENRILWNRKSTFECSLAPNDTTTLNTTTHGHGFPKCESQNGKLIAKIFYSDELNFTKEYEGTRPCLETLYDIETNETNGIMAYCDSSREEGHNIFDAPSLHLTEIRRCCSRGEVFDTEIKACVRDELEEERSGDGRFVSLLRQTGATDFLILGRRPPKCNDSDVLFDYRVKVSQLGLHNGTLRVTPLASADKEEEEILVSVDNACIELTSETWLDKEMIVRTCRDIRVCENRTCLTKCCAADETFVYRRGCVESRNLENRTDFDPALRNFSNINNFTIGDYGFGWKKDCTNPRTLLWRNWSITAEGHVQAQEGKDALTHRQYCIDYIYNRIKHGKRKDRTYIFVCYHEAVPEHIRLKVTARDIISSLNCLFLLLTFLVYACLPELRNLHGKTFMCQIASYIVTAIILKIEEKLTTESAKLCKGLAYLELIVFFSAFSWMNVMCYDIWWTFGQKDFIRRVRGPATRNRGQRKRFLYYCCYAWGFSLVMVFIAFLMKYVDNFPSDNLTLIADDCLSLVSVKYQYTLGLIVIPVTTLLIANVVFFVLTFWNYNKVKGDIQQVIDDPSNSSNSRIRDQKEKLVMTVKLFIVMGLTWILEIIKFFIENYAAWFKGRKELFYAIHLINYVQGFIIFILFVLKPRVYRALRKRLGCKDTKIVNPRAAPPTPNAKKNGNIVATATSTF